MTNQKKPGVLILNGCLPPPYGGIAKYLGYSLPILTAKGYKIWSVMPRNYSKSNYEEYVKKGINVIVPTEKRWKLIAIVLLFFKYFKWLWNRCFKYRLSLKEGLNDLYNWLPECDALLKAQIENIDIIHVYDAPWAQGWIGQILAEKYKKILMITTFGEVVPHDDPIVLLDEKSMKYKDFCRDVLSNYHKISSPTQYCASKLKFLGFNPKDVYITYHASEMEKFIVSPSEEEQLALFKKYPIIQGRRVILFVGQIQKRKGPDLLLRVAPNIIKQHPDCLFVFVGPDCGMLDELKSIASELGISNSCLFTGGIPDEEVYTFYHLAELFVFTTISQIECLGLVFVQAMFASCPVIVSNISGVPEVITHEVNGLLFEPGNKDQLEILILKLLNDKVLRDRLANRGFRDIITRFPETLIISQIEEFYKIDK